MKRESPAPRIAVLALLGLALSPVPAAFSQTAAPSVSTGANATGELETVEITGSLIRSTERTEFNQVQVITAEDLARSGEVTVSDYLRDLAVNSASSWADNFA
ncbi:MAG TPA: hypothetical protein VGC34_17920, partial [Steroidobacteraceae bacterium]